MSCKTFEIDKTYSQIDDLHFGGQFFQSPSFIFDLWEIKKIDDCYLILLQFILNGYYNREESQSFLQNRFSKENLEKYLPQLEKDGILKVEKTKKLKIYHLTPFSDWVFPEAKKYGQSLEESIKAAHPGADENCWSF